MSTRAHLAGIVAAVLVTAGISQAAHAEPLRLRYAVWPGYGPLFVAQEKGFFAEEGVELIEMEEHTAAFAGFSAGQVDAILGCVPDTAAFSHPDDEPGKAAEHLHLLTDSSRQPGAHRRLPDHHGKHLSQAQGRVSGISARLVRRSRLPRDPSRRGDGDHGPNHRRRSGGS